MDNLAGMMLRGGHLPELLEPQRVVLRIRVRIQFESLDQLPSEVPPGAFSENGLSSQEVDARLVRILGIAVGVQPHLPRRHAFHRPVIVQQQSRCRESGENIHPQRFRLLA